MMLNSRRLIGTPQKGERDGKGHEFTPIGSRARHGPGSEVAGETRTLGEKNMNRPLFAPIDESPQLARRPSLTSSFENTMDNFNNTITSFYDHDVPKKREPNPERITRAHREPDFINAAPSIMEQETRVKRLDAENYNLKIKVATLQKFLEQTPEEQRMLLSENIGLKQQLVEQMEGLRRLQESNDEVFAGQSDKENANALDDAQSRIAVLQTELKRSSRQNEETILALRQKCDSLEDKLHQMEYENPIIDELEHIRSENVNLKSILENSKSDHTIDQFQHRMDELQQRVHELQNQKDYAEGEQHKLDSAVEFLKDELAAKDHQMESMHSSLKSLEVKLKNAEQENVSLMSAVESLKSEVSESHQKGNLMDGEMNRKLQRLQSEIKESEDEITYWKDKYKSLSENKISNRGEFEDLNQKLDDYRMKYNHLSNKHRQIETELEDQLLKSESYVARIKSLEREVEGKDDEHYRLRQEMNSLLKSKSSNDRSEYLDQEIDRLRWKETEMMDTINSLRQDLDMTNTRHKGSDSSTELKELKDQIEKNQDRISYYEKAYDEIQKSHQAIVFEVSSKESELSGLRDYIVALEDENELLKSQIANKSSKTAIAELEDVSRRKLEAEKKTLETENSYLNNEIETLSYDMNTLRHELKLAKGKASLYPELDPEIDRLRDENRRLQKRIDDLNMRVYSKSYDFNSNRIEEEYEKLMMENNKLQNKIKKYEMDHLNDNLEKQIMIKNLESKFSELTSDDGKTRLLKLKANEESKVRKLEFDIDNMKLEHQRELDYFKQKLRNLESINGSSQSKAESTIISMLEKQLEDSQKLRDELSKKLAEALSSNSQISVDLSKVNSDRIEHQRRSESLQQHIDELNKLIRQLEENERKLKQELKDSEKKNDDLYLNAMDLNKYNTKLVSKVREMKQRELSVNDLTKKFSVLDVDEKQNLEMKLLTEELKYYRAKLYDINMRANDFEILYTFVIQSIKNSDQLIRKDLCRLIGLGVYPDYSSIEDVNYAQDGERKITFKSLALLVLSVTRMKRRQEKATFRKEKLYDLKADIESDKLKLLSYV